jgi:hypothetical protein
MVVISSSRDNSRKLSAVGSVIVQAVTTNDGKSREQLQENESNQVRPANMTMAKR